ncbi:hypothetical protein AMK16_26065 [Streptomyces sp. CB00455]|uniref:DUF6042 family protein n=1 Tax=Streptomyces sp. CB00455 TaxID=1703927 RepID=UPI00093FADBE|nr:DUF6042 family protein [Streptomyces sp. CB00455]OKK16168.1 hypothetical protein AMK16_26065 [Streptomyces sp. CB00455]
MSVDQDTNRDSDGHLALHNGWFPSGWPNYLPQHQAMMLCMVFGTAAVRGLRGSLDEVTQQLFNGEPGAFFGRPGGTLDSPVVWRDDDELEYLETDEDKDQFRTDAAEHQARCEGLLRAAGVAVPTTVRELADTMLALGIATVQDGVWSMQDPIPGPETILDLTDAELARIADMRRVWESGPAESTLLNYLTDVLGQPDEVFTSVDRLAQASKLREDDVRYVLGRMIQENEARVERGTPRKQVNLDDLKNHERFHLVADWQHFNENRIMIMRD